MSIGVIASHAVVSSSAYPAAVLADSPLAYWRLGDASGGTVVDSSGNGRNSTYVAAANPVAGLLSGTSDTALGLVANSGPIASIASASWMNVSALTVECLASLTSATDGSNGDAIVSHYDSSGFNWLLWRNTTGHWAVQLKNNSGTTYNVAAAASVSLSTIYHLAFTFDGSSLILYVGGSSAGSTGVTGTPSTGATTLDVGRYSLTAATIPGGTIDEVAVYGTALSSARIAAHYALI